MKNILLGVILVLIVANVYVYMTREEQKPFNRQAYIEQEMIPQQQVQPQIPQQPPTNSGLEVVLFYSDGCGHCRHLKEQAWPDFLNRMRRRGVPVREVDCAKENCGNIRGVPHIVIRSGNGNETVYNGPRTADDLEAWVGSIS